MVYDHVRKNMRLSSIIFERLRKLGLHRLMGSKSIQAFRSRYFWDKGDVCIVQFFKKVITLDEITDRYEEVFFQCPKVLVEHMSQAVGPEALWRSMLKNASLKSSRQTPIVISSLYSGVIHANEHGFLGSER